MNREDAPTPPAYFQNADWAYAHATELHRKYEGKWVAVSDGGVVTTGYDPVGVRQRAARETGRTTAEVYVQFMASAGTIYGAH